LRSGARQKKIVGKSIKQKDILNLLQNHNYQCYYCGIKVAQGDNLHLDHKIPLSKDGEHSITNLTPACATCNLKKGTKTDIEFLEIMKKKGL
jgi:5-methylcytosine-specific restriction endonuclease McrA